MFLRASVRSLFLGILLLPLSCTPLPGSSQVAGEAAAFTELPSADEVPIEWGSLVSVTPGPLGEESLMWFQDDAGTIRLVGYDFNAQRLWERAVVIRRR